MKPEFKLAKKLKGPSQMERVRAARAMINGTRGSEDMALHAFLDIFHPELSDDRRLRILHAAREGRGDRR